MPTEISRWKPQAQLTVPPIHRSVVCAIGMHPTCDGGAPNGPAADGPCECQCHEVMTVDAWGNPFVDDRPQARYRPWPAPLGRPEVNR